MVLIFRDFRSRAGDEERVLGALRKRAAAMIRERRAEAVLVCQRADVPQHLLWIEHHPGASVPAESSPSTESGLVESDGAPVRAEFIDGAYQFPLPPCRLWVAETSDEKTAHTLLKVSRLAASDRRISGVSIYRTVEDPSRMMAFFALAPDVAPDDYFKSGAEAHRPPVAFYPLRVSWTVGRLTPGTPSSLVARSVSPGCFLGPGGPCFALGDDYGRPGADHGSKRQSEDLTMRLVYVVTCGQCGQTWQRIGVTEGQTMECLFCGQRAASASAPCRTRQ